MAVRIRQATSPTDLDQLFQVRHRVFVEEQRYFRPVSDGRLVDRFDAFPTTANIVASAHGRIVGGVRIVEPSPVGAPVDELFDFRPHLPDTNVRVGSGSMLVVEPEYRRIPRVTFAMLGMMYYWALVKGLTHITGVAAPEAEKLFLGSGYEPVQARFFHEPTALWMLPVVLDIGRLNDRFATFVDRHDIRHFLTGFERQFHAAGETIITAGEQGSAAYVIVEGRVGVSVGPGPVTSPFNVDDLPPSSRVDGSASVRPPSSSRGVDDPPPSVRPRRSPSPIPVREMGPGEVFGELSLITSNPRSANVVALTDVDLMVLEREAFHKQVTENPLVALNLLAMLGKRLTTVTDRLQETTNDY
jgi:CRP-like cAMP-binding protein